MMISYYIYGQGLLAANYYISKTHGNLAILFQQLFNVLSPFVHHTEKLFKLEHIYAATYQALFNRLKLTNYIMS